MPAKSKRTTIALAIFGIVLIAVLGYLIYGYLSPPPAIPPVMHLAPTDVPTEILNDSEYLELRSYGNLPVTPTDVGRRNPFERLNTNANANSNVNSPKP